MNDVKYKIYTDIVMRDRTGNFLMFEEIPNSYRKYSLISKCKGLLNLLISCHNKTELLPYHIYLRYSIQSNLENVTDFKLEERVNRTYCEKYVELAMLEKTVRGEF